MTTTDTHTDNEIEARYMDLIGAVVHVACLDYLAIEKPEYRLTEYRIDEDGPTAEAFLDETDLTEEEIAATG